MSQRAGVFPWRKSPAATFGEEARSMVVEANVLEDAGTADMFTEISRGIDKLLWFVEAHSQAKT